MARTKAKWIDSESGANGHALVSQGDGTVDWEEPVDATHRADENNPHNVIADQIPAIIPLEGSSSSSGGATSVQGALDSLDGRVDILEDIKDSITLITGLSSNNATNVFLDKASGTPTNISPFIMPVNATLFAISAATNGNETWDAQIYQNGTLLTGASLSITAADNGYSLYSINVTAGDKISMYCNGTGITRPSITAFFRSR